MYGVRGDQEWEGGEWCVCKSGVSVYIYIYIYVRISGRGNQREGVTLFPYQVDSVTMIIQIGEETRGQNLREVWRNEVLGAHTGEGGRG